MIKTTSTFCGLPCDEKILDTDATVAAFDNKSGEGKYLAAYVVSDEKVDIKALNDFIKSKTPPYMVPAVTMQINKISLT